MIARIPRREDVCACCSGLFRCRQLQVTGKEIAGGGIVVALAAHTVEHERVLRRLRLLCGKARDDDDLVGELPFRHIGDSRRQFDLFDPAVHEDRNRHGARRIGHGEHPHGRFVIRTITRMREVECGQVIAFVVEE